MYVNRGQCADYARNFCCCMKIVAAVVTEIVKMLQKHKDPGINQNYLS